MWPVDQQRVMKSIASSCSKDTPLTSKYSRFAAVEDPLPIDQIDEAGLRRLKNNGLDVGGFRMYSIAMRDLDKPVPVKGRSPNKMLIKLGAKRLLTHADCMAMEEMKEEQTKQSIEYSLMRSEDFASKKIENTERKNRKVAEKEAKRRAAADKKRDALEAAQAKRAASAKRKLLVAQDKAEKRRIRASNAASRSKASRNEVGQANAALIFRGRVPPCTSISLPSEHVPTFPARQQNVTLYGSDEDVVEVVCL